MQGCCLSQTITWYCSLVSFGVKPVPIADLGVLLSNVAQCSHLSSGPASRWTALCSCAAFDVLLCMLMLQQEIDKSTLLRCRVGQTVYKQLGFLPRRHQNTCVPSDCITFQELQRLLIVLHPVPVRIPSRDVPMLWHCIQHVQQHQHIDRLLPCRPSVGKLCRNRMEQQNTAYPPTEHRN